MIVEQIPISLRELSELYRLSLREADHLISFIDGAVPLLEARMKPSAVVSVRFNAYEAYYISFLEQLKWKVGYLFIDEELPIAKSHHISAIIDMEYEHSGVAHPVGEEELERLRESLSRIRAELDQFLYEIDQQMLKSVFMCHSSQDKDFARKLARELTYRGAKVWIDEAEIRIGDSLIQKISEGIQGTDFLAVILSKSSVESNWVKKELQVALTSEINIGNLRVLPILMEDCEIPPFLSDKKYADFRNPQDYHEMVETVVNRLRDV